MTDANHQPADDLNRAVEALRATAAPPGPPDELVAATLAAIHNRLARRSLRRKWVMRVMKYGGASAGLAASAALVVVFGFASGSAAEDVKKAIRKAEQAKTVRFKIELDAGTGADGKMTASQWIDDKKMRSEVEPAGVVVVINDKGANKGLLLMKTAKTYRVLDPEKDALVKQVTGSVSKAMGQFKLPADEKVTGLSDEYLDGRRTKVYEMKDVDVPDMKAKADLKLWIDPKSFLPVRSQVVTRTGDKTITATATYLGFDEDLDPKLFDTTVPAGYTEMPAMPKK